jgi:hypothetical protein
MMHVNVMIATHDRWKLLRQTLKSLGRQVHKDFSVHVIVDGNPVMIPDWLRKADVNLIVLPDRVDVVAAYGVYTRTCESGLLMNASDDLVFHPECLSAAVQTMNAKFPRSMGVIGINQHQRGVRKGRSFAFTLMNRKYIDHFPDRIIFCPDYIHYCSDKEHGWFASKINCFFVCRSAIVNHVRVEDNTTRLGREMNRIDLNTFRIRQSKGLLWGREFDLIRRKG